MKLFILLIFVFVLQFNFAQTINTESPSFSAGGMTLQKNIFQAETNFGVTTNNSFSINKHSYTLPTQLIRYGISNRWEIRANPILTLRGNNFSLSSLYVGAKFNIIGQKGEKFQMSVIANYGLPFFSLYKLDFNTVLTFNYDIADKHSLGANAGYQFSEYEFGGSVRDNLFFGTLIYNYTIMDRLSCFIEGKINVDYMVSNTITSWVGQSVWNSYYWDAGLLFKLNDRIQIDYVYGMEFDNSTRFHMLGFHFMLNANKK